MPFGGGCSRFRFSGCLATRITNIIAGQYDGQPSRLLGALDILDPANFLFKHFLVEEEERAQGLILGRFGDVSGPRKMGKKLCHFRFARLGRMTHPVETDKARDPIAVRPVGPQVVMFQSQDIPDPVEQLLLGLPVTASDS